MPAPRPQLRRSGTDKVLGGVSGGLADYTGIDALLWRVGFVALALAGGTGVVVYLLLWLLTPAPLPTWAPGAPHPGSVEHRRPAGPRSPVPGITVAVVLITLGVLALIDRIDGVDLRPPAFVGAALLVVGLGLVVAAFTGGRTARGGLISLGVVLSLALVVVAPLRSWQEGADAQVGDEFYVEQDPDAVQPVYRGSVGDLTVDLTDLDLTRLDDPVRTRVEAGLGTVSVLLPRSADVDVEVHHGMGEVQVFDTRRTSGFFPGEGREPWSDDGEAEIELTVNMGMGTVEVLRG